MPAKGRQTNTGNQSFSQATTPLRPPIEAEGRGDMVEDWDKMLGSVGFQTVSGRPSYPENAL